MKLTIAYDGTNFRGLAPNPGVRTVVGELVPVLEAILGPIPEIHMSGRTDAGVHAAEQVLSFDVDTVDPPAGQGFDPARIAKSVSSRLGPEVVATSVSSVSPEFHARFSAVGRSYRYEILNGPTPCPPTDRYEWWIAEPLDLDAMNRACEPLTGEHDFATFCRRPKSEPDAEPVSLVRQIDTARWSERTDDRGQRRLRFEIAGPAFCHQMVRSITGWCVGVGLGRRSSADTASVLAAQDRNAVPSPAPPAGLTLWSVTYPSDDPRGTTPD